MILICNGKNVTTSKNSINISSCNWVFLLVSFHCGISHWCLMGSTYWLFVYLLGPLLWILWLKSAVTYCSLYYMACFFLLFFLFFFLKTNELVLTLLCCHWFRLFLGFGIVGLQIKKKEVSWIHCFTISLKTKRIVSKRVKLSSTI